MLKALYREDTQFLTKRGFIDINSLKDDDEICYLKDGILKTTKDFKIKKDTTRLFHYTLGRSNIFCCSDIRDMLQVVYNCNEVSKTNNVVDFSINDNNYYLNQDLVFLLQYLILNFFKINQRKKTISYSVKENPISFSRDIANALRFISTTATERSSEYETPLFEWDDVKGTSFTSDLSLVTCDKFISVFIDNFYFYKKFAYNLSVSGLMYSFDKNPDFLYLNFNNQKIAKFVLFILSSLGYNGVISYKSITTSNKKKINYYSVSFSVYKESNIKQQYGTTVGKAVGIILPEEGTLITSSLCNDTFTSIMLGPSYQE